MGKSAAVFIFPVLCGTFVAVAWGIVQLFPATRPLPQAYWRDKGITIVNHTDQDISVGFPANGDTINIQMKDDHRGHRVGKGESLTWEPPK